MSLSGSWKWFWLTLNVHNIKECFERTRNIKTYNTFLNQVPDIIWNYSRFNSCPDFCPTFSISNEIKESRLPGDLFVSCSRSPRCFVNVERMYFVRANLRSLETKKKKKDRSGNSLPFWWHSYFPFFMVLFMYFFFHPTSTKFKGRIGFILSIWFSFRRDNLRIAWQMKYIFGTLYYKHV